MFCTREVIIFAYIIIFLKFLISYKYYTKQFSISLTERYLLLISFDIYFYTEIIYEFFN